MDVREALDYAIKAPVYEAVGQYVANLVAKAQKAGQTETDGNNTVTYPDLSATEKAIMVGIVSGYVGGH